ncbi:MAG: hypothetical protein IJG37_05950 [Synergistaceae bacterium]|nr:hypothetical protein [Synergistaceae bacterium]MBQ3654287.1 hypothetical protein [Synergistaceae bacterium]
MMGFGTHSHTAGLGRLVCTLSRKTHDPHSHAAGLMRSGYALSQHTHTADSFTQKGE